MNRRQFALAAAVLAAGCNKRGSTPTDDKPAATVEPHTDPPKVPSKPQEPPRLTPRHRFKTGIREIAGLEITDDGACVSVVGEGLGDRKQTEVWELTPAPRKVREFSSGLATLSPDGKYLTRSGERLGETDVVDVTTGAAVCVVPAAGQFQRFAGPGRLVVVRRGESVPGGRPGALLVDLYDAKTGRRESGFEIPGPGHGGVRGPDARGLVNCSQELVVGWESTSRVEVWDLGSGMVVRGVTLPDARPNGSWSNFAASPDGKRVTAQRRTDRPVGVYDTVTGAEIATTGFPIESAFVPGRDLVLGRAVWVGEGSREFNGWRAYDLTRKAFVAELPGGYLVPAISADGRVMVTRVDRAAPDLLVWDLTRIP
jgi:hypothetical protein